MALPIDIRLAELVDVDAMSVVLCASIRELCVDDHHADEAIVAAWTCNKTPVSIKEWLGNSRLEIYVAELGGVIAAVGGITSSGEVALNYVSPQYRFSGVSRALLKYLEVELAKRGVCEAQLTSTATARRFYRSCGWVDFGVPDSSHAVVGFPMRKELSTGGLD